MVISKEQLVSYGIMLGLCILIGLVCLFGRKRNHLISFCLQGVISVGILFGMERLLINYTDILWYVSVSPFSFAISFVLGIPGVLMLYGIQITGHML